MGWARRWVWILLGLGVSVGSAASADVLYDNGPVIGDTNRCDQGPTGCAGSGTWTFYDNFILANSSTVTSFDYTDRFATGVPANYVETNWSLYDADPFSAAPIASGTSVATLVATGVVSEYRFEVSGLNIVLSPGVEYWLGTNNLVTGGIITSASLVANPGGGLDASKQSDGVSYEFDYTGGVNRAFRIHGTVVPEPSTGLLVALGLAYLGARGRRSRD